jgi:c-di-GMP-related signal transduction protein
MATQSITGNPLVDSSGKKAVELRYMARQPILDSKDKVFGYELLLWNGSELPLEAKSESDTATELDIMTLDKTAIPGLEQLTGGLPAFVNCTINSLTEQWGNILSPNKTVVELPGDSDPTPGLIANCRKLKASGFQLALVDCSGKPESRHLIEMADYIKVDIEKFDAAKRGKLLDRLKSESAQLVAENVETQQDFNQVLKEGFKLFQGYYFCRPELLKSHKIPGNRYVHLEILEMMQYDPMDLDKLSELIMCDASLTYRLLRLVNSPVFAMRQEVTSIKSALMLLGEKLSRSIAMLAIASDFNIGQSAEILRMAFERARFCELAASLCGLIPTEQFLIGMISMFPAMLRLSMEDLVKSMPLREQACEALLGRINAESTLLYWLVCHDSGDWTTCDLLMNASGMRYEQLLRCHTEAIGWAHAVLAAAE